MSFRILGRELLAEVRSPELESWLRREWDFPEHVAAASAYALELEELSRAPGPLAGERVPVRLHGLTLEATVRGTCWRMGGDRSGVEVALQDGRARMAVWGVPAGTVLAALYACIAEALRASGLLPLHAAVAVREGRATALAGGSGAGKSTTLWRAVQGGWAPLAEDIAWLEPTSGHVYGFDRGLWLRPDVAGALLPGAAESAPPGTGDKVFLPYGRLGQPRVGSAPLARLAVLRLHGGGVGREPLPAREAVRAWWEATGVPLAAAARAWTGAAIGELVQRVPTVRLRLGTGVSPLREL